MKEVSKMNQSQKDMVSFCLDFVKNNVSQPSQNVQCRNWLKTAMEQITASALPMGDFLVSSLQEADGYFSGVNSAATTNTVIEKIEMVQKLIKES